MRRRCSRSSSAFCVSSPCRSPRVLTTFLSRPILTGFFAGFPYPSPIGQVKRFAGGDDVHGELKGTWHGGWRKRHTAPCSLAPGVIEKIGRAMVFVRLEDALLAFEPADCRAAARGAGPGNRFD